jgi:uncharacterized SAM-binding protein YcdF (DUF218 family)
MTMAGVDRKWRDLGEARITEDEAEDIRKVIPTYNLHSIIVVTSPMHTRRACAAIEKRTRLMVTCVPAHERYPTTRRPRGIANHIETAREYFYERLAMIKYRLKGWL